MTREALDATFGEDSTGNTPEERARTSRRLYVRSLDQLAPDSPRATGRRLSALEALTAYGYDVLREVAEEGSALLCAGPMAAARAIQGQRQLLKLEIKTVANRSRLTPGDVERAEEGGRWPLAHYERIAQALGIDDRYVSVRSNPPGNTDIAIRLRTLGDERPRMTASAVSAIAEAAWVAMTQLRLETTLGFSRHLDVFERSANYGGPGYPAFMHGYYLAQKAREALGLGLGPLDSSLRELCEDRLGIPVIQTTLGDWIAGLTVETGSSRAIVLNTAGRSHNVFIRRSTLAHELGHLLFDPADRLEHLRVDEYEDLDRDARDIPDVVEQRANAFAVEFIAPQKSALQTFHQRGGSPEDGLRAVVESFGISQTAASYQLWNGLERQLPLAELKLKRPLSPREIAPWEGTEGFAAVGYHPLKDLAMSRTGRFSAVVVRAAQERVISWDTAASYLQASRADVEAVIPSVQEMYPRVFGP